MKKIKDALNHIFLKAKVKKLCFLSAMLGYKYTTDWIINHVPEAAYLIGDYLKKHPETKNEMMKEYFKTPDYIFDKAMNKYRQMKLLETNGFETEELKMMEGLD